MIKRPLHYCIIAMLLGSSLLAVINACNTVVAKNKEDDIRLLLPGNITDSIYLSPANPFSAGKAALGRYFFYDRRLSVNQSKACSSCHDPSFSFTDGYRRSIGALGDNVQHNAPALVNIIFNRYLTAADSTLRFPEQQIRNPLFHTKPVELGWTGNENIILERVKKDSLYSRQLPVLFPSADPFTTQNIQYCISSFVKTLISLDASYDRYLNNKNNNPLSPAQVRGMQLFLSERLHCSSCHGGINFSTPKSTSDNGDPAYYQNTGLYNLDRKGSYPAGDRGLYELTGHPADMGKYRISSLRNLAFTAPYFHDGSAASLEEVIHIYSQGGRGEGKSNPRKNPLLGGFVLNKEEQRDLIQFLLSLSDSSFCQKKAFSNPFGFDETAQRN